MDRCFFLLIDDDLRFYQRLKAYVHEVFHEKVGLDWHQKDGFSSTMICSGYYLLTIVGCTVGDTKGIDIIRTVKSKCPDQPVLFASGRNDPREIQEQAAEAGSDGGLNKQSLTKKALRELILPYLDPKKCPSQQEDAQRARIPFSSAGERVWHDR